jgi:hypothetical protein
MPWDDAISFISEVEKAFGGWAGVMAAWANCRIKSERFNQYLLALKVSRLNVQKLC